MVATLTQTEPLFPRNHLGQRVPSACPKCFCGDLRYEGNGFWRCDGLMDPGTTDLPLQACTYFHEDGKPVQA